jgi:hypothetical protein
MLYPISNMMPNMRNIKAKLNRSDPTQIQLDPHVENVEKSRPIFFFKTKFSTLAPHDSSQITFNVK